MESYDRICNCHAWRNLHLLPTYCKLTLWPHHPLPENKPCLPPYTVPCLCNSIITQFFVKVSQIARQGRQLILHNHRDSPSQAHVQPHGKALGGLLAELRAVAAPSGEPMTGLVLGDVDSAKLSSLNSSIGTYRKKMREFLLGCWKHSGFTSPRGTWNQSPS